MSVETIFCEELGCDSELQPVSFDECNPSLKYNEISKIYIANNGQPLTNWTDAGEWAGRISDTSTAASAIRALTVKGSLEIEFGERIRISGGRFAFQPDTYSLSAQIDENNDINYTFMRGLGCNRAFRAWIETSDGDLYGGNEGTLVVLRGREPITDDPETFRVILVEGEWQSALAALRIPSPIA